MTHNQIILYQNRETRRIDRAILAVESDATGIKPEYFEGLGEGAAARLAAINKLCNEAISPPHQISCFEGKESDVDEMVGCDRYIYYIVPDITAFNITQQP